MIKRLALILAFATLIPMIQSCGPEKEGLASTKPPTEAADKDYVGLPLSKAEELAESRGLRHRIIKEDGKPLPSIKDYRPGRVNFEIEQLKVMAVSRG